MNVPVDLKYDVSQHLWVEVDDNMAFIGITDFAQEQLGELLYVELPEEDTQFERGDEFAVVESAKNTITLEASFDFMVIEINAELDVDPENINDDPYGNWIVKVEITKDDGLEDLVDADEYKASL